MVTRYLHGVKRRYFRGDAAFANPNIYAFLEAEGYKYTIRLPANSTPSRTWGAHAARRNGRRAQRSAAAWS
jgi:hypothetical protein